MKNKHEEMLRNFFEDIQRDMPDEFSIKMTGYCIIYAPYYICFLETEDGDFNDYVLREIQNTIGERIHEQVWVLFNTEEVPQKAFDQFVVKVFPAQQSQAEIKALPMVDRVAKIYTSMLTIGADVRRTANDPSKNQAHIDSIYSTQSIQNLPAQEDLQSVIGPEMQTLEEHLEFYEPPDILLEDELCWPNKPDLDY